MGNQNTETASDPKKRVPDGPTLSREDQDNLTFFFGYGQSVFERSTCGAMLEALERDSCGSVKCRRCGGAGILGGTKYDDPDAGLWCGSCRGTGVVPKQTGRSKNQITAKPKKQSNHANGVAPDDTTLTKYAYVSRRIGKLQIINPVSVQVLAAYWGNAGTRWAATEDYSRLFPVLALTQAGATLIKRSQNRTILADQESDVPRDAHEQLGQIHLIQKVQTEPNRQRLFNLAFEQAEKLYDTAVLDWAKTAVAR